MITRMMNETANRSTRSLVNDDLDRAVFEAYGWDDLAEKLVGRPGATTPWPEKPEDQQEAEEQLLQRLVDLNHQRAAEEAQGKIRWLRPEYQAPEETPEQSELAAGAKEAADADQNDQTTKRQNDQACMAQDPASPNPSRPQPTRNRPHGPKHPGEPLQTQAREIGDPSAGGLD